MAKGFFAGSRLARSAPLPSLPRCGTCGLSTRCSSPKLTRAGEGRRVLFVGPPPTKAEDRAAAWRPNPAVKRYLDEDAGYTGAIICHPKKGGGQYVPHCRPTIENYMRDLQPEVVVPMGSEAVAAVLGGDVWGAPVGPVSRWAGMQIPSQKLNAWVCPTWDPAVVGDDFDPVPMQQFRDHVEAAVAKPGRPWATVPTWADEVAIELDSGKAAVWLREVVRRGGRGAVAWDYETNMLKPDGPEADIVSCAVTWGRRRPERTMAFPWRGEAVQAMGELLRSPIPKIASNLKFEDRWTRKAFGHRVRGWAWDTMVAAHVLDNRQAITSVKFQAFARLGVPVWNKGVEPFFHSRPGEAVNRISEVDVRDLLLYNGLDAFLEWGVAAHQMTEMGYRPPWLPQGEFDEIVG